MESLQRAIAAQSPAAVVVNSSTVRPAARVCVKPRRHHSLCLRSGNVLLLKVPKVGGGARRGIVRMGVEENYASALAMLAKEKDVVEQIYSDTEKLGRYFENEKIAKFFVNPVLDPEKKKELIRSIAKEEKLQTYTANFLCVLVDKKRMGIVKNVLEAFERNYYRMTDTEIAVVTSAVKVEDKQLTEIAKKIQSLTGAKNVKIKNVLDKSVIAGFKVRYGPGASLEIDLTVKSQLDKIAAELANMDSKVAAAV